MNEEGVESWDALLGNVRRVHPIFDKRRLVFYGLVDDGIQLVVGHYLQKVDQHSLAGRKVLAPLCQVWRVGWPLPLFGPRGRENPADVRRVLDIRTTLHGRSRIARPP